MCQRKYTEYHILVKYLNNTKEEINYSTVDKSSYKEMLKLYNETKEQLKDECVTIEFCGKTEDDKLEIMFDKKIINPEIMQKKEIIDRACSSDTEIILNNLVKAIDDLNMHRSYVGIQVGITSKKQDMLLHKIEHTRDCSLEDKIKMFNELQEIRIERRKAKTGVTLLDNVFEKFSENNIILKHVENIIKGNVDYIKKQEEKIVVIKDTKMAEQFKIMKEVPYRSFKERINLQKQLQGKYDKVFFDDVKMIITCYNNAR